jgi:hypothetical protein
MLLASLLGMLSTLSACMPSPVHYDCLGSTGCGYSDVKPSSQSIAVTGAVDRADERGFQDGRGRCGIYNTTMGFNNESRQVRVFILTLWVPASAPRYWIELRIAGYRGPGNVSTADNERFGFDPANGATVQAEANLVPSVEPIAMPTNVTATVDANQASGSLRIELPDRTIAGTWTCAPSPSKP